MGKDITEIKNELAEKNVLSMSTEELSTYIKDNISEKSNQEIIALLTDMWKDGIPYSFDFIDEIVKTRSMTDPYADSKAITIFYSGESEGVINALAATDNPDIRLIRRTEGFELLAYEDEENEISFEKFVEYSIKSENPDISESEIGTELIDKLYGTSGPNTGTEKTGNGLWTKISSRFAAETKADAYSLCATAKEDRIFARDENKQCIANLGEDHTMCGYSKSELEPYSGEERFKMIQQRVAEQMQNTCCYVCDDGTKVGQTFEGTPLAGIVPAEVIEEGCKKEDLFEMNFKNHNKIRADYQELRSQFSKGTTVECYDGKTEPVYFEEEIKKEDGSKYNVCYSVSEEGKIVPLSKDAIEGKQPISMGALLKVAEINMAASDEKSELYATQKLRHIEKELEAEKYVQVIDGGDALITPGKYNIAVYDDLCRKTMCTANIQIGDKDEILVPETEHHINKDGLMPFIEEYVPDTQKPMIIESLKLCQGLRAMEAEAENSLDQKTSNFYAVHQGEAYTISQRGKLISDDYNQAFFNKIRLDMSDLKDLIQLKQCTDVKYNVKSNELYLKHNPVDINIVAVGETKGINVMTMDCENFMKMIDSIPRDIVITEDKTLNQMRMLYATSKAIDTVAYDMDIELKVDTNDLVDQMFINVQKEESHDIVHVDAVIFKDSKFDVLKEKFEDILDDIKGSAEVFAKFRDNVKDMIKNLSERVKESVEKVVDKIKNCEIDR